MVSRRAFVGVVTGCLGTMCFFKNRDYIQAVPFKIPQTQSLDQFKEIVRQNKVWSINSYYMTAKSNGVNWYVHVNFYTLNMDREPKVGIKSDIMILIKNKCTFMKYWKRILVDLGAL